MEKEIRFGKAVLKVYDLFVIALIASLAILFAIINGAANLGISGSVAAPIIIGIEMLYIFGVVNKRNSKK